MSRLLLLVVCVMLGACVTLPRDVAAELEPVTQDRPDHFDKP